MANRRLTKLDNLKNTLATSGISIKNNALFQTIDQLIGAVKELQSFVQAGGGSTDLSGVTVLTENNEQVTLPASVQLLPGDNVSFDNSIPSQLTVDVSLDQEFITAVDETATLPNSRLLSAGTDITIDNTVPNVTTINSTGGSGDDFVVLSDGVIPIPSPVNDGAGNFIYVAYTP